MDVRFSTDDVREQDRFAFWADSLASSIGTQRLPVPDVRGPFQARFSGRSIGPIFNTQADSDAHHIVRDARDIARRPWEAYWIYREAGAGMWCKFADREFVSHTGDIFISDSDQPFETRTATRYAYDSWLVPKSLLDPYLPAARGPLVRRLDRTGGVGALAANYLDCMTQNRDSLPETAKVPVADILARLIGIACGAAAAEQPDAVRAGRLVEAKRHIERHLASPDLSPSSTAAALRISVRTLHELFESTGISFARHIARRRMAECRLALLSDPSRPVTDIAFAWGFNSLSTFYRAFHAAFGMTPADLRAEVREAS